MTDEIMYELMELSGQEYVDLYAAKVKAQIAAEGKIGLPDAAEVTDADRPSRLPTERAS
jgi:1-acyl-sn-glycerol-3-phosphate acyltransferase